MNLVLLCLQLVAPQISTSPVTLVRIFTLYFSQILIILLGISESGVALPFAGEDIVHVAGIGSFEEWSILDFNLDNGGS